VMRSKLEVDTVNSVTKFEPNAMILKFARKLPEGACV
jgi:hypothetical protein